MAGAEKQVGLTAENALDVDEEELEDDEGMSQHRGSLVHDTSFDGEEEEHTELELPPSSSSYERASTPGTASGMHYSAQPTADTAAPPADAPAATDAPCAQPDASQGEEPSGAAFDSSAAGASKSTNKRRKRNRRRFKDHDWLQQADAEKRRNWVSVAKDGTVSTLAMSKYDVSYYAGIPFRDLLILDPVRPVPYYAAIFLRPPGAIVISLEHMRLVICNEKALVLNAEEPRVAHFIADLSYRLRKNASASAAAAFNASINTQAASQQPQQHQEEDQQQQPSHTNAYNHSTRFVGTEEDDNASGSTNIAGLNAENSATDLQQQQHFNGHNGRAQSPDPCTATPDDVTTFVMHGTRQTSQGINTFGISPQSGNGNARGRTGTRRWRYEEHQRQQQQQADANDTSRRASELGSELNAFLAHFQTYEQDPRADPPPYPTSPTGLQNLPSQAEAMLASPFGKPSASFANLAAQGDVGVNPMLDLSFELRVLECVLKEVCERLDFETRALDEELTPALESLARRVRFGSLQRVRRMKSRMNRLMTRVDDVRDELRKLLCDDGDMRDMCLTTKSALIMHHQQQEHEQLIQEEQQWQEADDDADNADDQAEERKTDAPTGNRRSQTTRRNRSSGESEQKFRRIRPQRQQQQYPEEMNTAQPWKARGLHNHLGTSPGHEGRYNLLRRQPQLQLQRQHQNLLPFGSNLDSGTSMTSDTTKNTEKALRKDLEEERESVEALLEAFFIHSEQSKKRLAIMREAVNDTEDMNELNLDQIRNELFKVEISVTNATLAVGLFSAVAGAFGMNLRNGHEESNLVFLTVVGLTGSIALIVFTAVQLYMRRLF